MGKAPKPVTATVEELENAKTELKGLIAKLNKSKADKEEIQPPATKVQNNLDALAEEVKKNNGVAEEAVANARKEAKDYSDELHSNVRDEVLPIFTEVRNEMSEGFQNRDEKITKLDSDVREAFADELTSLCGKIEEEFTSLREELIGLIQATAQQAADDTAQLREDTFAEIEDFREKAAARDVETRAIAAEALRKAVEEEAQVTARIDATAVQDRKDLEAEIARLDALVVELRENASRHTQDVQDEATRALHAFRDLTKDKFDRVDRRSDRQQAFLMQVDQAACRRVEWCLKDASALLSLRGPSPGNPPSSPSTPSQRYVSRFSPKFNAAGLRDLQLELRLYFKPGTPSSLVEGDNCGLYLWSPKGLQMHLRFFAGEKWMTVEKGNGVEGAVGSKKMGSIQEHIDVDEDTIRVGVELLECIFDWTSDAFLPGHEEAPQEEFQVEVPAIQDKESKSSGGGEAPAAAPAAEVSMGVAPFEGTLKFHRHINHRVLTQVKKEVEKMQNKMVKRVEWLMSEADQMSRVFPHGQPICSPLFSAAGIDGMQFIFYPSGYSDSTEGFCSFFLYCPAGVNMKCSLVAGTQRREASNHFKEAGAYGRVNFCRLDSVIDTDTNTALLCLDIEEVVQETKKSVNKAEAYRKNKRQIEALELENADPPKPPGSSIKLVRIPNQNTLTEVNRIPAMWTANALGEFNTRLDGCSDFKDLVQMGKPGGPPLPSPFVNMPKIQKPGRRGQPQGEAGAADEGGANVPTGAHSTPTGGRSFGAGGTARSESAPLLKTERSPSMDAAIAGPATLPLLCGPQNEFGSEQGHGSPMLWAGKSRKNRSGISFKQ